MNAVTVSCLVGGKVIRADMIKANKKTCWVKVRQKATADDPIPTWNHIKRHHEKHRVRA